MGKGLPGGRRQAGRIDYRTEPNRSAVLPDRPCTARAARRRRPRGHRGLLSMMLYRAATLLALVLVVRQTRADPPNISSATLPVAYCECGCCCGGGALHIMWL
jgi:hypothetical protein